MTTDTSARPVTGSSSPPRHAGRTRRPWRLAAVAVVLAVGAGGAAFAVRNDAREAGPGTAGEDLPAEPNGAVPRAPSGTASPAGLAGLTAGTRRAYLAAQHAMAAQGLTLSLTSGYRSADEQAELYRQAIAKYGSPEAARIWVLPPSESQHVRGVAVDVAPREAARWLDDRGAGYGLCRTMEWEWWHFEYRAGWRSSGCPPMRRR
jgi:D-alanyl-D-alanine carboxypeptidase